MSTSFLLIVVLVILMGGCLALVGKSSGSLLPYVRNPSLFTAAERAFLVVLDQAAAPEYRVFGKVRIADVVSVEDLADRKAWHSAFNKISRKHFDYVLCRPDDLSFVCAVELDDKSHARADRKKRDIFVEQVCSVVGLPLLRVPARRSYAVDDIRQQLAAALTPAAALVASPQEPVLSGTAWGSGASTPQAKSILGIDWGPDPVAEVAAPPCPKCAGTMKKRNLSSGTNAGAQFWGCNDFPGCRGMIPIA